MYLSIHLYLSVSLSLYVSLLYVSTVTQTIYVPICGSIYLSIFLFLSSLSRYLSISLYLSIYLFSCCLVMRHFWKDRQGPSVGCFQQLLHLQKPHLIRRYGCLSVLIWIFFSMRALSDLIVFFYFILILRS